MGVPPYPPPPQGSGMYLGPGNGPYPHSYNMGPLFNGPAPLSMTATPGHPYKLQRNDGYQQYGGSNSSANIINYDTSNNSQRSSSGWEQRTTQQLQNTANIQFTRSNEIMLWMQQLKQREDTCNERERVWLEQKSEREVALEEKLDDREAAFEQ
ncbi:hypothetical protein BGX29_008207 [Mortierella sp. GBA35]|nr:hypothetical protein BGX29_008207 [Mortierella sp. GBA35]